MKISAVFLFLLLACFAYAEDGWKTVDEGFRMTIPVTWEKQKVQCTDSNCGTYKAPTADLNFDEDGRYYQPAWAQAEIDELKKQEANPKLLKPGEEIWRVDGRVCRFSTSKIDPAKNVGRRFSNAAILSVPYPGLDSHLTLYINYKSDDDLPTVRRILKSVGWAKTAKKDGIRK